MHKDGMMVNVLLPVIGQPMADQHDCIGGVATRSEASSTARVHGLTSCVMREIRGELLKEPSACGN